MSFLNSIQNQSKKHEFPFDHWEYNDALTDGSIDEIIKADIPMRNTWKHFGLEPEREDARLPPVKVRTGLGTLENGAAAPPQAREQTSTQAKKGASMEQASKQAWVSLWRIRFYSLS